MPANKCLDGNLGSFRGVVFITGTCPKGVPLPPRRWPIPCTDPSMDTQSDEWCCLGGVSIVSDFGPFEVRHSNVGK